LLTQNFAFLETLNTSTWSNFADLYAVVDRLGITIGDTDYDGLTDIQELEHGTSLTCIDTDCDNLNDAFEIKLGTDPIDDDTDGDGVMDGVEVIAGYDPLDATNFPGMPLPTTTLPPSNNIGLVIGISVGFGGMAMILLGIWILKKRKRIIK
jgi:hypothetical protein